MSGTSAVVLGAGLVGVLLVIVAVMVWQESRSRFEVHEPEYILEEAVRFVHGRLDPDVRGALGIAGVRRILEWQVYFLQRLAKDDKEIPIVMGITEGTVAYIVGQLAEHGYPSSPEQVTAVLEEQGAYLIRIGAVGEATDEVEF